MKDKKLTSRKVISVMVTIQQFICNPFEENTYVLSDETGECVIVDPGCHEPHECDTLKDYIESNGLKPVALLNTHCHIDHVLGNRFVYETYGLRPCFHILEKPLLEGAAAWGAGWGIFMQPSPEAGQYLNEKDTVRFGNAELNILFVPGHSPGSIAFHHPIEKWMISGDVLFHMSIGRTDLPGGNHKTLLSSICTQFWPLDPDTIVYPGHGTSTTIGKEKAENPFFQ